MRIWWSRRTRKGPVHGAGRIHNLIVAPKVRLRRARGAVPAGKATAKGDGHRHQRAVFVFLAEENKILFGLRPCDTCRLAYAGSLFLGSTDIATVCAASFCVHRRRELP